LTNEVSRELKVLESIKLFISDNGYPPTYREIQNYTGIKSLDSVFRYMYSLKEKGLISFNPRCARTIVLHEVAK